MRFTEWNLEWPEWMSRAACKELPSSWFFLDEDTEGRQFEKELKGLCVCRICEVREECLDDALKDRRLDHGIRGGKTSDQRKHIRRKRRKLRLVLDSQLVQQVEP